MNYSDTLSELNIASNLFTGAIPLSLIRLRMRLGYSRLGYEEGSAGREWKVGGNGNSGFILPHSVHQLADDDSRFTVLALEYHLGRLQVSMYKMQVGLDTGLSIALVRHYAIRPCTKTLCSRANIVLHHRVVFITISSFVMQNLCLLICK